MLFGGKTTKSIPRKRLTLSANQLTAVVSVLFALFYSAGFWKQLMLADLPSGARGVMFLAAAGALMVGFNLLLLSLVLPLGEIGRAHV